MKNLLFFNCLLAVLLVASGYTMPRLSKGLLRWHSLRLRADENAALPPSSDASPSKQPRKTWDMSKCLYFGNLPPALGEEELKTFIHSHIGPEKLDSIRLMKDKNSGASKGYAYVNFKTTEDAQLSVSQLASLQIEGNPIKVTPRIVRSSEQIKETLASQPRLYIANLAWSITEEGLRQLVEEAAQTPGVIKFLKIPKDELGRSKGYGFVELTKPELVDTVIEKLNGFPGEFKPLIVERAGAATARKKHLQSLSEGVSEDGTVNRIDADSANPRVSAPRKVLKKAPTVSVFIGNLSWSVTQELLEEMLTDVLGAGQFLQIRIAKDPVTNNHRGFAHIDFKDEETATHAINELNGMELLDRVLRADRADRNPSSPRRANNPAANTAQAE